MLSLSPSPPALRLVLGLQPVREAIRAHGHRLTKVAVEKKSSPILAAVERFARDQGVVEVVQMPRAELDRLARGAEHQGAVAWAPPLQMTPLEELCAGKCPLVLALDGIQDPQNFGALIRSAVGIANAAILWGEHGTAPLSVATFRASAGAIEHAQLCRVPALAQALQEMKANGATVIGLDTQASELLDTIPTVAPTVLVVGSEHRGLSRPVRQSCTVMAKLRNSGRVASLNASVAAGIGLYLLSVTPVCL